MSLDVIIIFVLITTVSILIKKGPDILKKSKLKKIGTIIKASQGVFIILYIIGVSLAYLIRILLKSIDEPNSTFTFILLIIISLICIPFLIYLIIKFIKRNKAGRKAEYYREIPKTCSVAMASYIMNQKIERKKDVFATIINLVAKKAIDIVPNNNGEFIYKPLNNKVPLKEDEQYIYNWLFAEDKSQFSILTWQNIIKKELLSHTLIQKKHKNDKLLWFLFGLEVILLSFFDTLEYTNNISYLISDSLTMLLLFPTLLFIILKGLIKKLEIRIDNYTLTQKGALIYQKIRLLEKFLKHFSIIHERKNEEVYIWEEYLAFALVLDINVNYKDIKSLNMQFLNDQQEKKMTENIINRLAALSEDQ